MWTTLMIYALVGLVILLVMRKEDFKKWYIKKRREEVDLNFLEENYEHLVLTCVFLWPLIPFFMFLEAMKDMKKKKENNEDGK